MNYSDYRLSLDIHDEDSGQSLNVKRGDNKSRRIYITLRDGSQPYHISDDCYAVFTATKPDGKILYNTCSIEDCTIVYELTGQTTNVPGVLECEIRLYGADNQLITSPRFLLIVGENVYSDDEVIDSSDEFTALMDLVSEAVGAIDNAQSAADELIQRFCTHKTRVNPKEPLDITTYAGGKNQPTHPKVLYFAKGWNGHKYWMTYTPYPGNNSKEENPCITYSDDGITWSEEGLSNPIATAPSGGYNSDAHIVVVDGTMECWWREVVSNEEIIVRKKSTDGVTWGEREELFRTGTTTAADCVSPSVIYDEGKYKIWVVYQRKCLKYYESEDGANWKYVRDISINPDGSAYKVWHFDIIKTSAGYEFVGCYQYNGEFDRNNFIYYAVSSDNITYSYPVRVLTNGYDGSFDMLELYRPCLVKLNDGTDHVYYNLYYGAQGEKTIWSIGLVQTSDIDSLKYHIEQESLYYYSLTIESSVGDNPTGDNPTGDDTTGDDITGGDTEVENTAGDIVPDWESSAWAVGYVNDSGVMATEANYHHSSYITMPTDMDEWRYTYSGLEYMRVSYFDADLNYLGCELSAKSTTIVLTKMENAVYCVINANTTDKTKITVTRQSIKLISDSFDDSKWEKQYFDDAGALKTEPTLSMFHSSYMPIVSGTVNFGGATYGRLSYFDADLNFLGWDRGSGLGVIPSNISPKSIAILTDVENAVYYVINANTADKSIISVS